MRNSFFKTISILLVDIFLFLAVSCSGDVGTVRTNTDTQTNELCVITNIGTDGTPEAKSIGTLINAPAIEGVLLKYQDEGLYNPSTSFFAAVYNSTLHRFVNPNAFYLEYLYGTETTHYGMDFNYVLYVPTIIRTVYENGNGKNPNSGNGFWWYMSTYYGQNMNNIRNNWEYTLTKLLINRIGLAHPKASDVTGSWKTSYVDSANTSYNDVFLSANIGIWYYGEGETRNIGTDPDQIMYFSEGRYSQKQDKGDNKQNIFIPSELYSIYFAGSGVGSTFEALLWYFETYYHIDAVTVGNAYKNGQFETLLDGKTYVTPKAGDIKQVKNTIDVKLTPVNTSYTLANAEFYASDILRLNGTAVQDKECVYYSIDDGEINIYFPEGYINQMKTYKGSSFAYNGDILWDYANHFCTSEVKGETSVGSLTVSAGVINQLLNYRVSTGLGTPLSSF